LSRELIIYKGSAPPDQPSPQIKRIGSGDFRRWISSGEVLKDVLRFSTARAIVPRLRTGANPLITALTLRWVSRGKAWFEDEQGNRQHIDLWYLTRLMGRFAADFLRKRQVLRTIATQVRNLQQQPSACGALDLSASPLYLRTDLVFGLKAGGSVGHIAGVLNNLNAFCGKPVFATTDHIPTVQEDLELLILETTPAFWDFRSLPELDSNAAFIRQIRTYLAGRRPAFIYQRYSTGDFTGMQVSHELNVPFVLEFNGSEIWVARNWGKRLPYEHIFMDIELLNLRAAKIVVVVSAPIRDELVQRGIAAEKILVNPNGVDADKYSPRVSGLPVRQKWGLEGKTVVGFIGTFGAWHGADLLVNTYGELLQQRPDLRTQTRLLLIGDGPGMPRVRSLICQYKIEESCILTGLVPQARGPEHLAACDILVNATIPNPDGTHFFGSPTKLFEYMAMGKGIVSADLDQMSEVLLDGETAWLFSAGKTDQFVSALLKAIESPDEVRRRGANARAEVERNHTWRAHTGRIIDALSRQTRLALL
jgi:glycosyltransferase involved in cell wall biosynthesis